MIDVAISALTEFHQSAHSSALNYAIQLYREILLLLPESHHKRSTSLCGLAAALVLRFQHSGQIQDLDEAISLHATHYAFDHLPILVDLTG